MPCLKQWEVQTISTRMDTKAKRLHGDETRSDRTPSYRQTQHPSSTKLRFICTCCTRCWLRAGAVQCRWDGAPTKGSDEKVAAFVGNQGGFRNLPWLQSMHASKRPCATLRRCVDRSGGDPKLGDPTLDPETTLFVVSEDGASDAENAASQYCISAHFTNWVRANERKDQSVQRHHLHSSVFSCPSSLVSKVRPS